MLLQQPHGDPEIQHYEKFQQRINKKDREQDPETHTEVKYAKALFSFQTSKPVQLVAEQCHQIIFHGYLYFEDYHLLWIHRAQWRAYEWNGQFAVLTEGKRMTHHHVCTAHQFGNFIHLTVFYNYSFFHTI